MIKVLAVLGLLVPFVTGCGKSVESLIEDLKDPETGWSTAFKLGEIGDRRAVEPLVEALKRKDTRVNAIWSLGKIGDKKAVEPLMSMFDEEEGKHRDNVVMALGRIGDKRAVDLVIRAMDDNDDSVRREAAQSLGMIGDRKAVDPLRKRWKEDKDRDVRIWAAFGLVRITGDGDALKYLTDTLNDQEDGAHCGAARALGLLGDERAVRRLIVALSWADWFRVWAHDALQEITGEKIGGTIKDLDMAHEVWEKWYRKKHNRSPDFEDAVKW